MSSVCLCASDCIWLKPQATVRSPCSILCNVCRSASACVLRVMGNTCLAHVTPGVAQGHTSLTT